MFCLLNHVEHPYESQVVTVTCLMIYLYSDLITWMVSMGPSCGSCHAQCILVPFISFVFINLVLGDYTCLWPLSSFLHESFVWDNLACSLICWFLVFCIRMICLLDFTFCPGSCLAFVYVLFVSICWVFFFFILLAVVCSMAFCLFSHLISILSRYIVILAFALV